MSSNPANFVTVAILLNQFLSVQYGPFLSSVDCSGWLPRDTFPESYIHIFWAWEYIVRVSSEGDRTDDLHSLRVVHFPTSAWIMGKDADRTIKRSADELSTWGCKINVSHCSYVTLMDSPSFIKFSHVEWVAVGVIVADHKVDGLQRVKAYRHGFIRQSNFLNCSLASQVVEDNWSIDACPAEKIGVGRIILDLEDAVHIPFQLINGLSAFIGPDLYELPRSCELLLFWRMIDVAYIVLKIPRICLLRYFVSGCLFFLCLASLKSPYTCSSSKF